MGARHGKYGHTVFGYNSGTFGGTLTGGSFMKNKEWSTDETQEKADTTNFESTGPDPGFPLVASPAQPASQTFNETIAGVFGCKFTFKGDWRSELFPFQSPPGVFPRDDLTNTAMVINNVPPGNVVAAKSYRFPIATVESAKLTTPVRGVISIDASGESNGPYVRPSSG